MNCTSLQDVDLSGVDYLYEYAFYGCTSLSFVILPDSLFEFGYGAFDSCSSLTTVVIEEGMMSENPRSQYSRMYDSDTDTLDISEYFEDCDNLKMVILPPGYPNTKLILPYVYVDEDDEEQKPFDVQVISVTEDVWHKIQSGDLRSAQTLTEAALRCISPESL